MKRNNNQLLTRMIIKRGLYTNLLLMILISSCKVTKNSYYFQTLQKDTTLKNFITQDYESKIKKGDNLGIVVSSLSQQEDIIFNQAAGATVSSAGTMSANGFMVGDDGNIQLHKIGAFKAEGFTLKELKGKIKEALSPWMKDVVVNIKYLNRKVTVLGEVTRPSVLAIDGDQMPLIDALVLSGDVTENAKRNDIMIIREEGEEKKVKHVNLQDHSIFSSPWYYLQPNDIVYVFPDNERKIKEEKRKDLQSTMALVVSGVSLVVIVVDRILR